MTRTQKIESPSRSRKLSTALKFTKSSGEKKIKIKTEKYF